MADRNDTWRSDPANRGMVGTTNASFEIGPGTTTVALEMSVREAPARMPDHVKKTVVTLTVENMTGDKRAPPFKVYLNLPDGDAPEKHPELMAGTVGMFGLVESSDSAAVHGGKGLTNSLDVTELFDRLRLAKPRTLKVSFVPSSWDAPVPRVRVGRVSLHWLSP